jgi:4-amino-4-deoxy-L-arabinose transferase-like glycosyltransferase
LKWLERPRNAAWFIVAVSVLHALYNLFLPLYPDEAYYWLWSRHLALSYYDHPPMVAYLIRFFTLGGDNLLLVRLTTVACMGVAAWFIYRLAREMFSPQVAALSLVLCMLLPGTNAGYTLVTPDSPLIMFWAMALYYCWRAITTGRGRDYVAAGVVLGGLLLSKYTSVLFFGFLFLFLLLRRPRLLLRKEPWLAVLLALVLFLPVVVWNAEHGWISFAFQYQHGTDTSFGIHWGRFFEFFGGLFVLFSPVFFAVMLGAAARVKDFWGDDDKFYLVLGFLVPLLFFLYKGLFKKMELNWVAPALLPGGIYLAQVVESYRLRRTFRVGAVVSALLIVVMFFPGLFPFPPKINPHNRLFGYRQGVEEVVRLKQPGDALFADHLTIASIMTYYAPGHPSVMIPIPTRPSEYTYWDRGLDYSKMHGICLATHPREAALQKVFSHVVLLEHFVARAPGFRPKNFYIYRCGNPEGP